MEITQNSHDDVHLFLVWCDRFCVLVYQLCLWLFKNKPYPYHEGNLIKDPPFLLEFSSDKYSVCHLYEGFYVFTQPEISLWQWNIFVLNFTSTFKKGLPFSLFVFPFLCFF